MSIEPELLAILVCPQCRSTLSMQADGNELACQSAECGLVYPVRDDIPVMLIDEARRPAAHG